MQKPTKTKLERSFLPFWYQADKGVIEMNEAVERIARYIERMADALERIADKVDPPKPAVKPPPTPAPSGGAFRGSPKRWGSKVKKI